MLALARTVSSQINFKHLAHECEIPERDVKKYFSFLEKTFVSGTVRPFFTNKLKEIVKQPKIYFYDTGFLRHVLGENLGNGQALEQLLFIESKKKGYTVRYWRDKPGNEVDFIIWKEDGEKFAYECKSGPAQSTRGSHVFSAVYSDIPLKYVDKASIFDISW